MDNKFNVYLRALELDDYKKSINWRQDEEIWSMVTGPKYFVSTAYEKKWVEDAIFKSSTNLSLAICLKDNDEHIGYAYIKGIDWKNRNAITGKLIGEKKYWGKGIGTEVTRLILQHAFEVLGLERIESRQLTTNKGSIKALEKCGYKQEGILRNAVFKDGEFKDLNIMSVLKQDYLEKKSDAHL